MPRNLPLRAIAGPLALALGVGGAVAASLPAGQGEAAARASAHFLVQTVDGPVSDRLQRETLATLEQWHRRFLIIFEAEPPAPMPVRLHRARTFHAETGAPPWADGVYASDGAIQVAVGGRAKVDDAMERVLAHELAHAFITHLSAGRAPGWLQEGLAQALTTRARPGTAAPTLPAAPDELSYAGSLAFTQALLARAGAAGLRDALADLGNGWDLSPAFERRLGAPLHRLFASWREGEATVAPNRAGRARR